MCVVQRGKDDSDSIKLSRKMVPKVQLKQLYLGNTCTHTCVLQLRTVTYSYVQLRTVTYSYVQGTVCRLHTTCVYESYIYIVY